ncbi:ABC transporter permease [Roseinatronobacter sp. S2]|uniref:ABC transporter permease n=1 Tax=Roseinatronobacter sp. S2 TaxID=3035471 RepID=UPI00240FE280|nr:ABC transporter permease [Roseinatronobacter sp. S2]WFE76416.1 ABC transporter permease [Roseinatronobacter sp. S2]
MARYIATRILYMIPTIILISIVSFMIIQLPPGDYLSTMVARYAETGEQLSQEAMIRLRERYGLGEPMIVQYWYWITNIVFRGDFGMSFAWGLPVSDLIWSRLGLTVLLSLSTLFVVWIIALTIGIYSAVNQYSIGDYVATTIGFLGLAIPNFLLALVLMYLGYTLFGQSVGGLFSPQYEVAPWSFGKFLDLLSNLWIPILVLGTAGTASLIRETRANLLDEMRKPYVTTARAKGLKERTVIMKYPVRIALNFFVSAQATILVTLISGEVIVSIVLSLPTTGPLLLGALMSQDMYLAASFILMLSVLNVISTLLSDIALTWLDPRIRYD